MFTDWNGAATAFGGDAIATNAALAAKCACAGVPAAGDLAPAERTTPMIDLDRRSTSTKGGGLVTVVDAGRAHRRRADGRARRSRGARAHARDRRDALPLAHARPVAQGRDERQRAARRVARRRLRRRRGARAGDPGGPACHTSERSCFGTTALRADALAELDGTIAARAAERCERQTALPTEAMTAEGDAATAASARATRGACSRTATCA